MRLVLSTACRATVLPAGIFLLGIILFVLTTGAVFARPLPQSDEITSGGAIIAGRAEPGRGSVYRVNELTAGDTLYLYVSSTSGNLDPIVYVTPGDVDIAAVGRAIIDQVTEASRNGADAIKVLDEIASASTLGWDDDSGPGYAASLAIPITADGDYLVAVGSTPTHSTSGDFSLLVGRNTSEVASGRLDSLTSLTVVLEQPSVIEAVEIMTGTLTSDGPFVDYRLVDMRIGDTLTAYVEQDGSDLLPGLILQDFGGKALATANLQSTGETAALTFTFEENPTNYLLRVRGATVGEAQAVGDYRLVLGRNSPAAAGGAGEETGPDIVRAPQIVDVRLRIDQITDVNQIAENFSIVANLTFDWQDAALAFSPDTCNCQQQVFRTDRLINDYFNKNGINEWPAVVIFNQQGGRSAQSQVLVVNSDGSATYFERFTATLQAPDFNFRQFPFDVQQFYVRLQSLYENDTYILRPDVAGSGFGEQLGEEEWIFSNDAFTAEQLTVSNRSQAVFGFTTYRHLSFYIFRIFIPVLLIIMISWIAFFLRDYGRRIEVASGNLLLFIAYNFTIANDLPRIGYLTFTDVVIISTFVITGLVVIINVWLRRLDQRGRDDITTRWDGLLVWSYPLLYLLGGLIVTLIFFPPF